MKQHKKSFFREAAEQWWDEQEEQFDMLSDLDFNEITEEDIGDGEEEQSVDGSL